MPFDEDFKKEQTTRSDPVYKENLEYVLREYASFFYGGAANKWYLDNEKQNNKLNTQESEKLRRKAGTDGDLIYGGYPTEIKNNNDCYKYELKTRSQDILFTKNKDILIEFVSIYQPLSKDLVNGELRKYSHNLNFKDNRDTFGWFLTSRADLLVNHYQAENIYIVCELDSLRKHLIQYLDIDCVSVFGNEHIIYEKYLKIHGVKATLPEKNNGYYTLNGFMGISMLDELRKNKKLRYFAPPDIMEMIEKLIRSIR